MSTRFEVTSLLLGCAAAVLLALAPPVQASPRVLVVGIEDVPAWRLNPQDVRSAIAHELRRRVVSPIDAPAAADADAMIVGGAADRVVVSLHASPDRWLSRSVRAPSDDEGRLRVIAWLAGNLGREQVALAQQTAHVAVVAPSPAVAPSSANPPTSPPAMPELAIGVATPQDEPSRNVGASTPWSVAVLGGPALSVGHECCGVGWYTQLPGIAWDVRLTHVDQDGRSWGASVELGPGDDHVVGVAGALGTSWRRRRLSLETTIDGGLALDRRRVDTISVSENSATGLESTRTSTLALRPAFFARPALAAGVRVAADVELITQLAARLSTSGLAASSLIGSVGLRVGWR